MKKTLYLMRHAKSDWQDPALEDFDRTLSDRGERTAPIMGAVLRKELVPPDHVLCSPARRAVLTWQLVEAELGADIPVTWSDDLYLASTKAILKVIAALAPPNAETLLVVGHNPDMEQLAAMLAGPGSDPVAVGLMKAKFPTAAIAVLEFDGADWSGVKAGRGRLIRFIRPRDVR